MIQRAIYIVTKQASGKVLQAFETKQGAIAFAEKLEQKRGEELCVWATWFVEKRYEDEIDHLVEDF